MFFVKTIARVLSGGGAEFILHLQSNSGCLIRMTLLMADHEAAVFPLEFFRWAVGSARPPTPQKNTIVAGWADTSVE